MKPTEPNKIFEEATQWIARLRSDQVNTSVHAAFSRWLNRSAAHEQAFDAAYADWEATGALKFSNMAQASLRHIEPARPSSLQWLWQWQGAALASLALTATLAFNYLPQFAPTSDADSQHFATQRGEQKLIKLADGSEVKLNTDSEIHIEYSAAKRYLVLEKGQAFFKVASNRARPFVVNVGDGTVTAVGTAFGINRTQNGVRVTVMEGIVSVKEKEVQPELKPESKLVKADEQLVIDKQGLSHVTTTNASHTLAWRDSLLVLEAQPLPQALAELNRYLDRPIDASDPSLAKLKVSGTFSLQTPESTLAALITSFNLAQDNSGEQPRLYARDE